MQHSVVFIRVIYFPLDEATKLKTMFGVKKCCVVSVELAWSVREVVLGADPALLLTFFNVFFGSLLLSLCVCICVEFLLKRFFLEHVRRHATQIPSYRCVCCLALSACYLEGTRNGTPLRDTEILSSLLKDALWLSRFKHR